MSIGRAFRLWQRALPGGLDPLIQLEDLDPQLRYLRGFAVVRLHQKAELHRHIVSLVAQSFKLGSGLGWGPVRHRYFRCVAPLPSLKRDAPPRTLRNFFHWSPANEPFR